jgi:hypothetical protein
VQDGAFQFSSSVFLLFILASSVAAAVNHLKTLDEYGRFRVSNIPFFAKPDSLPTQK